MCSSKAQQPTVGGSPPEEQHNHTHSHVHVIHIRIHRTSPHKRNINKYDVHVKRRLPYLLKFWFLFSFFPLFFVCVCVWCVCCWWWRRWYWLDEDGWLAGWWRSDATDSMNKIIRSEWKTSQSRQFIRNSKSLYKRKMSDFLSFVPVRRLRRRRRRRRCHRRRRLCMSMKKPVNIM